MDFKSSLRRTGSAAAVVVAGLATVVHATGPAIAVGSSLRTERVNVSSTGAQNDDFVHWSDLSADGRYVVFASSASELVPGDTNASTDIFLRDRQANTTTRISVSSTGVQSNGQSSLPQISADGRYVTFVSRASNLVPGPQAQPVWNDQIYLVDVEDGTIDRISETPNGRPGNGPSLSPSISADGRYVAFTTSAPDLIPGAVDEFPRPQDVVLYDRTTQKITLVSVATDGTPSRQSSDASLSDNGRYVAFTSLSNGLVHDDFNMVNDIFVRDLVAGTTVRASLSDNDHEVGTRSDHGQVSDDGRYVTFWSADRLLVRVGIGFGSGVFMRDLQTGTTRLVSTSSDGVPGQSSGEHPSVTADGRHVVFDSHDANLVAGDTNGARDVFRKDLQTGTTTLVSRSSNGTQGDRGSILWFGGITPNGKIVTYMSDATNLVDGDTNGTDDVFVTELPD
ncbi:hypothetical protein [Actinoplanes sp. NPDC049118]|uniref:TolB family protein n=1 Tax=Actinoplanes sp. NPDC049118 TaxID=3155769 RepID=UPI0033FCC01D